MMTIDPYTTSARRGIKLLSRILRRYQPRVARRLFARTSVRRLPLLRRLRLQFERLQEPFHAVRYPSDLLEFQLESAFLVAISNTT